MYTPTAAGAGPSESLNAPLVPLLPKRSYLMGIKRAVVSTSLLATQALGAPLEAFRRKSSSAHVQMAAQEPLPEDEMRPVACQAALQMVSAMRSLQRRQSSVSL